MTIARVELTPCVMRKEDPNWRFALGANPTTEGIIVRLIAHDGVEGFGYASATPHMGATTGTLMAALERFVPIVTNHDPAQIEKILNLLDRDLAGNNQAKAAMDCALHDLLARRLNVPLCQLFGGKVRECVDILRILGIKAPDEMADGAERLIEEGYRYLKIKLQGDVKEDVARVKAIRKRVGDSVHLTVDANQSYGVKNAIAVLTRMAEFGIDIAEQPVNAGDVSGLKLVTESVPVTVEADESAGSLADVMQLVSGRIVDAVSLKVPKLGGLRNALAAARICEAGNVAYRMGAAVGSRLLSAQAMHLAAALPGIHFACELGEFDRLLDDPFQGIEIENGRLNLPEGAGSGVSLRQNSETGQPVQGPKAAAAG